MNTAKNPADEDAPRAKALKRREPKACLKCGGDFLPTGANHKRCARCGPAHQLESNRARWHQNYVKKGRPDQRGEKNLAWQGGRSPDYYRAVCFAAHGRVCACGRPATIAHHIDHDSEHKDNRAENLRPVCRRCHQLEHGCAGNLPAPGALPPKKCIDCEEDYLPGSARALRCPDCKTLDLRRRAREKYARKRAGHGSSVLTALPSDVSPAIPTA